MISRLYHYVITHRFINWFIVIVLTITATNLFKGDLIIGIVIGIVVYYILNPARAKTGIFTIKESSYEYTYGDRLSKEGNSFNGMFINIPVNLPHIYVDLHNNDDVVGSIRSFKDISPLKLEANFGTNASVYASAKDRLDVLTILNPATMDAILSYADSYEFECSGSQIILYSKNKVYYDKNNQVKIIEAANKILESLNQTITNWQHLKKGTYDEMSLNPNDKVLKIGKYSVGSLRRLVSLALTAFVSAGFYAIYVAIIHDLIYVKKDHHLEVVLFYVLFGAWLTTVFSILYIGFSRKKINVTL